MWKYIKNRNGWAMVLTMVLIAVVPILATALYMYSSSAIIQIQRYTEMEQARYLARSGTDALIKVWLDADAGNKPEGEVERVYFTNQKKFVRKSELTENEIENNTIGYCDSIITSYTDSSSENYGSSVIQTTAYVNGITQTYIVKTSSILTGAELGWYSQSTGQFNLGTNEYEFTVNEGTSDEETRILYGFDVAEIVSCNPSSSSLTIPRDKTVGITTDAVFFKKTLDIAANSASGKLTALVITSKHTVFDEQVKLKRRVSFWSGNVTEYATLVLNTSANTGITLDGKDGLYSMVYFNKGAYNGSRTLIEPGTAWYVKKREGGVDLLKWYYDEGVETDYFFMIQPGDANKVVPSESSLITFTYE